MGKIIESYALQEIIGEGMYGKVYKAVHLRSKEEFAVKVIPITKFQENPKLEQCTVNQINILSKIETNPFIIRYVEMLKTPNNFYFIYEYCNGRTLESLLKQEGHLSETRALKIFRQLLEAFKVLNKYNIMHRDLKPDNIFFHNGTLKLGDFGFCKTLGKSSDMASTMLGSPIYMAPEVLKGQIYTSKADIWSLGVVLFQMLFGFCPFESNSIAKLISVLEGSELHIPLEINNISVPTQNLLKRLLIKDQFKRIDWFELLQYEISEAGYINEKKGSDTKLQELKEILSQKTIGGYHAMPDSLSDDYSFKKMSDSASNSSGSKQAGNNFNRQNVKVDAFDDKPPMLTASSPNYYETKRQNSYQQPKKSYEQTLKTYEQVKKSMDGNGSLTPPPPVTTAFGGPSILRKNSLPSTYGVVQKRKNLLEQHSYSIGLMRSDENNGVAISYIIFGKIQERLRKIAAAINSSDIDVEDITLTINNELKMVEKQLNDLREELAQSKMDTSQIADIRTYLRNRFKERSDHNLNLWHEMVQFVKGQRVLSSDASPVELTIMINTALI